MGLIRCCCMCRVVSSVCLCAQMLCVTCIIYLEGSGASPCPGGHLSYHSSSFCVRGIIEGNPSWCMRYTWPQPFPQAAPRLPGAQLVPAGTWAAVGTTSCTQGACMRPKNAAAQIRYVHEKALLSHAACAAPGCGGAGVRASTGRPEGVLSATERATSEPLTIVQYSKSKNGSN